MNIISQNRMNKSHMKRGLELTVMNCHTRDLKLQRHSQRTKE